MLQMRYMYLSEADVEESEAVLQKVFDFLSRSGMFGTCVTNFAFERIPGGYTAVEIFPSTMAYENYVANFKKCGSLAVEILNQRQMVDETASIIYGSAAALAASPSIAKFYPTQRKIEETPDLELFGEPWFGWRHAPIVTNSVARFSPALTKHAEGEKDVAHEGEGEQIS